MQLNTINVNNLIDQAKLTRFHFSVFSWCYIIILFDGYDVTINGVVLPLLMKEWALTTSQAGLLASMAIIGMMLGAMSMGILADKIGRRKSIIICVVLFSGFTFLGGFSTTPYEFGILRFLAGIGIGGVIPNLTALTAEYAPKRLRSTLVTAILSGTAVGAIMAALMGKWLVQDYGWQMMFYIAGIPLLLLPFILKFLPESLTFLVKKQHLDASYKIIAHIAPESALTKETQLELDEEKIAKSSVQELFKHGRAKVTFLFSCSMFMALFMLYSLGSWLPKLMINAGYSMNTGLTFLLVLSIGAVIGNIFGGMLADKFNIKSVLVIYFLMGAISLSSLSFATNEMVLYGLVACAGASASACSMLLYSYIAQYYPLTVRSTGLGWASAVGRIGAIVGPIILGFFLGMELSSKMNFVVIAIPALIGACTVFMIKIAPQHPPEQAVAVVDPVLKLRVK